MIRNGWLNLGYSDTAQHCFYHHAYLQGEETEA